MRLAFDFIDVKIYDLPFLTRGQRRFGGTTAEVAKLVAEQLTRHEISLQPARMKATNAGDAEWLSRN